MHACRGANASAASTGPGERSVRAALPPYGPSGTGPTAVAIAEAGFNLFK